MTELVFWSVLKIMQADWLLNGPRFYNIGPIGPIRYLFRTGKFWREKLRDDFNEI